MNFSEIFKQGNNLANFSPNGRYIASSCSLRLIIRDVKSLQTLNIFTCCDEIEMLEWSPDSNYILCAMLKKRVVQVWSIEKPQWTCKIDECHLGLVDVRWSPDSRHILTSTKFNIKITIWSLVTKSLSYMKYAKQINQGLVFRNDGKYMALVERRDCQDHISIFDCSNWFLVQHFKAGTNDLAGISFSPNGDILCVWETLTEDYKVLFYFLDGNCVGSYRADNPSLGIKKTTWSPTGQFFAIGGYDQKVRLLNTITWKAITEFVHQETLSSPDIVVYREVEKTVPKSILNFNDPSERLQTQNKYEVVNSRPVVIPSNPLETKPNPKHGVGTLLFSEDGRYLATVNDNMPSTLWIWSIEKLALCDVLIHNQPIRSVAWSPTQVQLALCTSGNAVYIWTLTGCMSVEVPSPLPSFHLHTLRWQPHGDTLLLLGKDSMCLCFLSSS